MWDWISGLDQGTGTFALPLWVAGAAIILLLVTCVIALRRAGPSTTIVATSQIAVVLIVAGTAWAFINQSSLRDRASERRAIDARAMELTARAITSGSPLACLDALAGETVENACEKAVFASAETAASAVSYIAARLTLLADAIAYADQRDPSYEPVLAELRRKLEADRYGLVAHVMATRDGCSADQCEPFGLLRDTSRVSANLKEGAFDQHVARYAAAWGTNVGTPVAATSAPGAPGAPAATPPGVPSLASSSTSGPIFPSSASIPPVSIMNAEPTGTAQPGPAAATAAPAATATAEPIVNPPTPPRRPPRRPPTPTAAPAADPPPPAQ